MAKLNCKCGHQTSLSEDNENEFFLLSDLLIEKLDDRLDANNLTSDDMNTIIADEAHQVYRCEQCKRLYMYDTENGSEVVRVYNLEKTLRD